MTLSFSLNRKYSPLDSAFFDHTTLIFVNTLPTLLCAHLRLLRSLTLITLKIEYRSLIIRIESIHRYTRRHTHQPSLVTPHWFLSKYNEDSLWSTQQEVIAAVQTCLPKGVEKRKQIPNTEIWSDTILILFKYWYRATSKLEVAFKLHLDFVLMLCLTASRVCVTIFVVYILHCTS